MGYLTSFPDDSQPLRYVDNPELMVTVRSMAELAIMARWMRILWLRRKELVPVVQRQSEAATMEVRRMDL